MMMWEDQMLLCASASGTDTFKESLACKAGKAGGGGFYKFETPTFSKDGCHSCLL